MRTPLRPQKTAPPEEGRISPQEHEADKPGLLADPQDRPPTQDNAAQGVDAPNVVDISAPADPSTPQETSPAHEDLEPVFDNPSTEEFRANPPEEIVEILKDDLDNAINLAEALSQIHVEHPIVILVKRLSDLLLLSTDKVMPHERALVDEILVRLVAHVDVPLRVKLAHRIAGMAEPPVQLLLNLASDDIAVAAPILSQSTELRNADLIEIIRHGNKKHRLVIAERKAIDSAVADALIDWGEVDIMETLLKNEGTCFSYYGLERLVSRSRYITSLQKLILNRTDLHPTLAYQMFWWLPADLRAKVFSRFTISRRVLQEAIRDAVISGEIDINTFDPVQREALDFIQGRRIKQENISDVIMEKLKKGKLDDFLLAFAESAGVSRQTLIKIMRDEGGEALAALCKSINLTRNDCVLLFQLLSRARNNNDTLLTKERLLALFDSIPRDIAELMVCHWDRPRSKAKGSEQDPDPAAETEDLSE